LRGIRFALQRIINRLSPGWNKYKHSKDPKGWLARIEKVLENDEFNDIEFSEDEVAATVLLAYPSFGKTKKKKPNQVIL
jgi:hypothetical protein